LGCRGGASEVELPRWSCRSGAAAVDLSAVQYPLVDTTASLYYMDYKSTSLRLKIINLDQRG